MYLNLIMEKLLCLAVLSLAYLGVSAGESTQGGYEPRKIREIKQYMSIDGWDNAMFTICWYSNQDNEVVVNNINSGINKKIPPINVFPNGELTHFLINPAASNGMKVNFSMIFKNRKKTVAMIDKIDHNKILKDYVPSAIAYNTDGSNLAIADVSGNVYVHELKKYTLLHQFTLPFAPESMKLTPHDYFLVGSKDNSLLVWNLQDNVERARYTYDAEVNEFCFSFDFSKLAVLTADGKMYIYNTATFIEERCIDALGEAKSVSFHPDNKYIAVITNGSKIAIINIIDPTDRIFIDDPEGKMNKLVFIKQRNGSNTLFYTTTDTFKAYSLDCLTPYYGQLISASLDERMNEWMKVMPNETMEEYRLRVTDENRMAQMELFTQEIATELAGPMLMDATLTLGDYNIESNMLFLEFDNMPSIYLTVPTEEVLSFENTDNLEFRNEIFGLTLDDKFELIYAEVYNKETGKVYEFNNLERKSLEFLKSDNSFVPIEIIQQASMEELRLHELKEEVVAQAMNENLITNNTNISVNAQVLSEVNAAGRRINNYEISFSYTVNKEFSAQEDFAPGKYRAEQSGAASSMIATIAKVFNDEFKKYLAAGKTVRIEITGMADGLSIHNALKYNGEYGDFTTEPVYQDDILTNISVNQKDGIGSNEQLAFIRAMSVKNSLGQNIPELADMKIEYENHIKVAKDKGGEFRRISVVFTFVDAF